MAEAHKEENSQKGNGYGKKNHFRNSLGKFFFRNLYGNPPADSLYINRYRTELYQIALSILYKGVKGFILIHIGLQARHTFFRENLLELFSLGIFVHAIHNSSVGIEDTAVKSRKTLILLLNYVKDGHTDINDDYTLKFLFIYNGKNHGNNISTLFTIIFIGIG